EPTPRVRANCVVNSTFDALKPLVPALAMLLPRTSMVVSLRTRPLSDVFSADVRPINHPPAAMRTDAARDSVGRRRGGREDRPQRRFILMYRQTSGEIALFCTRGST